MKAISVTILILTLLSGTIFAQSEQDIKPKTKLEKFITQDGVVIIQGFSKIETMRAKFMGSIAIECKELFNANNGTREYGITIQVLESGRIERSHTSYIDYDEIESLIKGIDYISGVSKANTKLDMFQAEYRTRGDLVISTFSTENEISAGISSGTIGKTSAFVDLSALQSLKSAIANAKLKLDSIKQ